MIEPDLIYLRPGELHFGAGPGRIRTLLGSCVAATLWHPQRCIGAMCHVVLPDPVQKPCGDYRYVDCVLEHFMAMIRAHSSWPGEYRVGVFGGGHMFPGVDCGAMPPVGQRNAQRMREGLKARGFRIGQEEVGGYTYRRLELNLETGDLEVTATPVQSGATGQAI